MSKISKNTFLRALSNPRYDYYKLMEDIGDLEAGAIFVHDQKDKEHGDSLVGCLKLCCTLDGQLYNGYYPGSVVLPIGMLEAGLFGELENLSNHLKPGCYNVTVFKDGFCFVERKRDESTK